MWAAVTKAEYNAADGDFPTAHSVVIEFPISFILLEQEESLISFPSSPASETARSTLCATFLNLPSHPTLLAVFFGNQERCWPLG